MQMIPVQRPSLGEEELQLVAKVFDSRWLGMGSTTKEFQDEIQKLLGVRHAIAVNTGTSALHLALDALGIIRDDEVLVPSLTFAASIQAIVQTSARPVFCDVEPDTLNVNPFDIAQRVTPAVRR